MNNQILLCNFDNQNEINQRILERTQPLHASYNCLDFRPESTKYTLPNDIVNKIKNENNEVQEYKKNNLLDINIESKLKNQDKILNNNPDNCYIPSNNSTMFSYVLPKLDNTAEVLYPNLFNQNIINTENKEIKKNYYTNNIFNTDTRQQLKD